MDLFKNQHAKTKFTLEKQEDLPIIARVCEAMGDETRLQILRQLRFPPYLYSIPALEKLIGIPRTTLLRHLDKLEQANLVSVVYRSAASSTTRMFMADMASTQIDLHFFANEEKKTSTTVTQSCPVGQYVDFSGEDLGFSTSTYTAHFNLDDCFHPKRLKAEIIYSTRGQITYAFSNKVAKYNDVREITFSLELCSEAPYYNNDYLSDITFWINDREIATYLSLGDYGDRKGLLNPDWWPDHSSQYGKLVTLTVNDLGVTLNGKLMTSKLTIKDLHLAEGNRILFRLGNKPTDAHQGGFNIFGSTFGDYPQDIVLQLTYEGESRW